MKKCASCKKLKNITSFSKDKRKDGRYVYCRNCQSVKYKKWFQKNGRSGNEIHSKLWREKKRKIIINLKSRPCSDCGISYPYYVMDFDHIKGKKYKGIAKMVGEPIKKVLQEIKKCELVCANCHRIRTHKRRTI